MLRLERIVSGGQTGADQAALDVAIELSIPHGGWVPKGRKTECGPQPAKYQVKEMPKDSYQERTEQNVIDSDGTLIISHGPFTGGSDYTRQLVEKDLGNLDELRWFMNDFFSSVAERNLRREDRGNPHHGP
jgi:hypothetical protein